MMISIYNCALYVFSKKFYLWYHVLIFSKFIQIINTDMTYSGNRMTTRSNFRCSVRCKGRVSPSFLYNTGMFFQWLSENIKVRFNTMFLRFLFKFNHYITTNCNFNIILTFYQYHSLHLFLDMYQLRLLLSSFLILLLMYRIWEKVFR